ncbi:MAG: flagellar biosynthesis protein FlhB [Rhodospirillaceae bacterium]|jgi:flagellar biosynthesis protein FlhB|nr:flagellar biosynthesis protein FlhB [Rhodospirillaceae bacterium]MBT4565067.1 flagellar biosynthesis protein FlhB [Rhodospirillaceae bacterium]MBT4743009.1 flagellar biosynthesis protein FlhB [Rhodospirillaceae bacterium]MBT5126760.1 flagellar biosynthesis protein FlhB [Rhodospirillaceae bacterium]MBT6259414.1 flagellar biosynthesis protein FlhB [Rhodospirillaceae bacterium]
MSDDQDKSEKTEEPTAKRIDDAFKKGQVPKSQEMNHWFMLAGGTLVLGLFSGDIAVGLVRNFTLFLAAPHTIPVEAGTLMQLASDKGFKVLGFLFMPLLILVGAALAGNMLQHRLVFSPEKMVPKLANLSPLKGAKKIFGSKGAIDLLKAMVKIFVVGGLVLSVVWPDLANLRHVPSMDLIGVVAYIKEEALTIALVVLAIMAVVGLADIFYQRYDWFEGLRMSVKDLKDESKQSEGDPHIKAKIRQLRGERARTRMMAEVPDADVVITNPTHFAVALKYDAESMAAPKVVAKGQDNIAFRIREVAEENNVPIVENPPLARGLYASADLDREIPTEFFKAVAEVIGYVMRLQGKMRGRSRTAG